MTHAKFLIMLLAFMWLTGCAPVEKIAGSGDSQSGRRERPPVYERAGTPDEAQFTFSGEAPKTLAIFPFQNNSVTHADQYNPLCKGLAAMLITDLSKTGASLKVIERENIKALIEEMAFSESGVVDEGTAVKLGKTLGAQAITFGSFIVFGEQVRIDARIINVETSELVMAESITGESKGFMMLVSDLARKIARSFKVVIGSARRSAKGNIDAALIFSRGLDAYDKGDEDEARRLFKECIRLDPGYKKQVQNVMNL